MGVTDHGRTVISAAEYVKIKPLVCEETVTCIMPKSLELCLHLQVHYILLTRIPTVQFSHLGVNALMSSSSLYLCDDYSGLH